MGRIRSPRGVKKVSQGTVHCTRTWAMSHRRGQQSEGIQWGGAAASVGGFDDYNVMTL